MSPEKRWKKLCKNWVTSFYTLKIEGKRLIRCFLKPIVGYVGLQKWEMGLRTYLVKIRRWNRPLRMKSGAWECCLKSLHARIRVGVGLSLSWDHAPLNWSIPRIFWFYCARSTFRESGFKSIRSSVIGNIQTHFGRRFSQEREKFKTQPRAQTEESIYLYVLNLLYTLILLGSTSSGQSWHRGKEFHLSLGQWVDECCRKPWVLVW